MAFKTFAPGVLTSSDVNTFLMRQAVIVCTSSTRPGSPNEGMTIYETDTDLYRVYSGTAWEVVQAYGAWTAYTPTIQTWALGNGTISGFHMRVGRMVTVKIEVTFGSTSTFGGTGGPAFSLPFNRANPSVVAGGGPSGVGYARDTSTANAYPVHVILNDSVNNICSLAAYQVAGARVAYDFPSATVPFTWESTDTIKVQFTYEATL
jgi:hypothetical protein